MVFSGIFSGIGGRILWLYTAIVTFTCSEAFSLTIVENQRYKLLKEHGYALVGDQRYTLLEAKG